MKTNKPKLKNIIIAAFPLLLAFLFLFLVWLWGNTEDDGIIVIIFLVAANIVAMWFPAMLICQRIDKRFERLEEILDKKPKDE